MLSKLEERGPGGPASASAKRRATMEYFAGIDVSLEESSICVMDASGEIVLEAKVLSEADDMVGFFAGCTVRFKRVGLEAGPLSQWLHEALAAADVPVVCVETRHLKAALGAMRNKTDRNDARGIAEMIRLGWYRAVHVKTMRSRELRLLLNNRKAVQSKLRDIENEIRGTLRGFGLKLGRVGAGGAL